MVTFPGTKHHHPLAGTKLYCLVTEAHKGKGKASSLHTAPLTILTVAFYNLGSGS